MWKGSTQWYWQGVKLCEQADKLDAESKRDELQKNGSDVSSQSPATSLEEEGDGEQKYGKSSIVWHDDADQGAVQTTGVETGDAAYGSRWRRRVYSGLATELNKRPSGV